MPFVTAHLEVAVPQPPARLRVGPLGVPTPGRVAYYLGLGALVAVELVEWPVALAVAAASHLTDRTRSTPGGARAREAGRP
ncbi:MULTISPECIES: hypothetical protein [Frankia]|uniref:hypothetical protein n=1 Tax=Frankia TaxID=1854 RepID=UPI001CDD43C9|nr:MULTISPECIES: hypothetical protein [Frankia]